MGWSSLSWFKSEEKWRTESSLRASFPGALLDVWIWHQPRTLDHCFSRNTQWCDTLINWTSWGANVYRRIQLRQRTARFFNDLEDAWSNFRDERYLKGLRGWKNWDSLPMTSRESVKTTMFTIRYALGMTTIQNHFHFLPRTGRELNHKFLVS